MIDFNKVKLGFENIYFENRNISTAASRSDISVAARLGDYYFSNPVIPANMSAIETLELLKLYDSCNMLYFKHRINGVEDVYNFCKSATSNEFRKLAISIGVKPEWIQFLHRIKKENIYPDFFLLDVANSYNSNIIEVSRTVYQLFPESYYIIGNGMTAEWINWLENIPGTRVDAAKVSVGVSASCRTAMETAYKSSTISHLDECASAAKRLQIIADGGLTITNNQVDLGCIAKAIRFGADMIMSGSIFSRCSDNPAANGGNYFGNSTYNAKGHSDNIEGCVININQNYVQRGTLETIKHIEQSLQSSISYCGGTKLEDLRQADYYIEL